MEALRKNLRQEHVLIHDFLSTFYTQARGTCICDLSPASNTQCLHASPADQGRAKGLRD